VEDSAQRRWSGAVRGAIRDIAAEPDEDAARVEQLRGHAADHLFKHNWRGSPDQAFSRGSVSAEMAIRSAARGISMTHEFSAGNLSFKNEEGWDLSRQAELACILRRRFKPHRFA
jgi:hypothetical protein